MARPIVLLKLFLLTLLTQPVLAQAPAAPSLAFDAVSIKPNRSASGSTSIHTRDDRFQATNLPLKTLIRDAFDLQTPDQVIGLPGWTESVNFDIEAKIDAETLAILKTKSPIDRGRLMNGMMQTALADRFQLKAHPETRELPIFELTLAKGGSKLIRVDAANPKNGNMSVQNQNLAATGIPISNLCQWLSRRLHRRVVDKTGLIGVYNMALQWAPDEASGESADAAGAAQGPSLFTALQEQLGLKLESAKGPVETIVVDHIQMPSEN